MTTPRIGLLAIGLLGAISAGSCSAPGRIAAAQDRSTALGCEMTLSLDGAGPEVYKGLIDTAFYRGEFVCPFDWRNDEAVSVFTHSDAVESRCGATEFGGLEVTRTVRLDDRGVGTRMQRCMLWPMATTRAPAHANRAAKAFVWRISNPVDADAAAHDLAALGRGLEMYVQKSGLPIYRKVLGDGELCLEADADVVHSPRSELEGLGFSTDIDFVEEAAPGLCESRER